MREDQACGINGSLCVFNALLGDDPRNLVHLFRWELRALTSSVYERIEQLSSVIEHRGPGRRKAGFWHRHQCEDKPPSVERPR